MSEEEVNTTDTPDHLTGGIEKMSERGWKEANDLAKEAAGIKQFNLDQRIEEAITLPVRVAMSNDIRQTYVYSPDVANAVRQLLKDFVAEITPEQLEENITEEMSRKSLKNRHEWFYLEGFNTAITELERKANKILEGE